MNKIDPCDTMRANLIAAAVGLQQCTKTAGTETHIPGTDKRILIGNDAYLAKVAAPAAKDGIASLEGLTKHSISDGNWNVTDYFKVSDVERLLASTAGESK